MDAISRATAAMRHDDMPDEIADAALSALTREVERRAGCALIEIEHVRNREEWGCAEPLNHNDPNHLH